MSLYGLLAAHRSFFALATHQYQRHKTSFQSLHIISKVLWMGSLNGESRSRQISYWVFHQQTSAEDKTDRSPGGISNISQPVWMDFVYFYSTDRSQS